LPGVVVPSVAVVGSAAVVVVVVVVGVDGSDVKKESLTMKVD
jgi:hypothetical protein